jgi:hypothetical protein
VSYKRLLKLIEYMESLPASANKHFGMRHWFDHTGKKHTHGLIEGDVVTAEHLHSCGTRACAAGWASTMPYFRKLGLKLVWSEGEASLVYANATWSENDDFTNLAELFELDRESTTILFGAEAVDETPKQWAKRARHCMKVWQEA